MIRFERTEHKHPYGNHVRLEDIVGALVICWDKADPRPAIEQHDEGQMGNGPWSDSKGKFTFDPETYFLKYPGDPAYKPLAIANLPLTKQKIIVYDSAWVVILDEDKPFADSTWTVDRRD